MIDLEREIQVRRQKVCELEQKIAELRAAQAELELLEKALSVLQGNGQAENLNGNEHKMAGASGMPSSVDLAQAVLKEARRPLLIDEIVARIEKQGFPVRKDSLVSTILRNCKTERPTFRKMGRSLYALADNHIPESALHPSVRDSGGR